MKESKILVIEDETDLAELMAMYLRSSGFHVALAGDGDRAMKLLRSLSPDMVVLDIELPDTQGTELCRVIRESSTVPIIFVTCRGDAEDIYTGLSLGADDYMTKPFDPAELVARIQGHLRKREIMIAIEGNSVQVWRNDRIEIDLLKMEVSVEGSIVPMYSKELQLLQFFIENPNRVFSVEELFERVWSASSESDTKTVYAHIHNLRKKLERDPDEPELIKTVRGIGYKFIRT